MLASDRVIDEFLGCPFKNNATIVNKERAVGDAEGFADRVVSDEDRETIAIAKF